jgi:hypothetical protein
VDLPCRRSSPFLFRLARIDADVGTGQQGAQPRHATGADLRTHHPEARILGGKAARFLAHVDRYQHPGQVLIEGDGTHLANVDILVFDLGLARLQASALLKLTVTVGPWSRMDLAPPAPISAASSGMSHTSEGSQRLPCSTSGSGNDRPPVSARSPASLSDMLFSNHSIVSGICYHHGFFLAGSLLVDGVPDQTRIELHRRQHGQHHHGAEGQRRDLP